MVIATIFEVCLHILQYALRAFSGFDLLYFIEIIILDSMITFIDYFAMQVFNTAVFGQATTLVQTVDAVVEPIAPSLTRENVESKSKLVPPTSFVETSFERNDQKVIVPEVQSFFIWKICQALSLPATFVPQQSDTAASLKQFKKSQPVPIVYSVTIFEMCKALKLNAKLANQ
ncbi:hypothetical protein NPIL_306451 [Nephila pilipes]|uniref:Uncharacterized protein n=1 Tax=Nephila pilipes TaxID=299642 RepID=A0A8X6PR03_NEPPI|nr:hypothetical protein NPIL_306451 [Nephila pilipes]